VTVAVVLIWFPSCTFAGWVAGLATAQTVGLIGEFLIFLLVSSEACDPVLCSLSSGGGLPQMKSCFSISRGVFPRILNLFSLVLCSKVTQLSK
jgi:hypothetical protein